jgi:hypothetical protein
MRKRPTFSRPLLEEAISKDGLAPGKERGRKMGENLNRVQYR